MSFLTIITVSHYNYNGLILIYDQISHILNENIQWVIKDSGKCINTKEWSRNIENQYTKIIIGNDTGIYNALNIAIKATKSEFYLVIGSDDTVFSNALLQLLDFYENKKFTKFDIITFPIIINNQIYIPRKYRPLSFSISRLISSHSVGTIIRTSLHDKIGLYDETFKILADSYLLRLASLHNYKFTFMRSPVMGVFSTNGVSSKEVFLKAKEAFSYNLMCGSPITIQFIYYCFRLLNIYIKKIRNVL
jgi:hypothetical protein